MPQHRLRLITAGWQSVCNVCESNCSQSELDCNCLETGCSDPEVDTVACPSSGWPVGCCSYLQPLDGQWLILSIHKEVVILSLSRYPLQTTASPIWKRMKKIKTHNYFSSVAQNKTNTTGLSKLKTIRQQCEYFQIFNELLHMFEFADALPDVTPKGIGVASSWGASPCC